MQTKPITLQAHTHDHGSFSRLKGRNVLIYWPHGFGDWVQFSVMLPYLEQTNRYWITRFGDDSVSVMDGHSTVTPIYLGVNSPHCDDGRRYGCQHFGLSYNQITGGDVELQVPIALHDAIRRYEIESMLWTSYPETHGSELPPRHTKARSMAAKLIQQLPPAFDRPLKRSISLNVSPLLRQIVESRLRTFCGFGERRLCLVGRSGYTAVEKNWGYLYREDLPTGKQKEGSECEDFIRLMLRKDKDWCFLLMEDRNFGDSLKNTAINTFAYSDAFGEPETACLPFGQILKCLVQVASLCVGVPAGPYHLAAQVESLPTVGIWIDHLPSWYDEPREGVIHLIGSHAAAKLHDPIRPGSFLHHGRFSYVAQCTDSRTIAGEAVMAAAESIACSRPSSRPYAARRRPSGR